MLITSKCQTGEEKRLESACSFKTQTKLEKLIFGKATDGYSTGPSRLKKLTSQCKWPCLSLWPNRMPGVTWVATTLWFCVLTILLCFPPYSQRLMPIWQQLDSLSQRLHNRTQQQHPGDVIYTRRHMSLVVFCKKNRCQRMTKIWQRYRRKHNEMQYWRHFQVRGSTWGCHLSTLEWTPLASWLMCLTRI